MPRRISDYPDAFAGWNLISSFGSIISVVATWLFLYIVYVQLVEGRATSRYPWLTPQFYSDSLQTLLNRSSNSLEWALSSPPKPHAFVSLPLQSNVELDGIITELSRILPQLSGFIEQFNDIPLRTGISVIVDNSGNMSIDAPNGVSDSVIESTINRYKTLDTLINTQGGKAKTLLETGMSIEKELKQSNPNYTPQLIEQCKMLQHLNMKFKA
jgi:hypothetical protein